MANHLRASQSARAKIIIHLCGIYTNNSTSAMYYELVTLIFCDKGLESSRALKFPVRSPVKYAILRIQSHDRNAYEVKMASEDGTGRGVTDTIDTVTADADA